MSHIVIPFNTRLVTKHAKHILQADRARASKFLAGHHPHGPNAIHELRKRRHHHHHHHHGGATTTDPSTGGGTGTGTGTGTGSGTLPSADGDSIDVTNAGVTYTMQVGVGSPRQDFTLLIDTGSSNTWVGAQTKYKPSSTAEDTRNTFNVSYGSGQVSGTEYIDQVTLGPQGSNLVIPNQSFGSATTAQGFDDVDGIVGIGPVDLTQSTVENTNTVPTVTDNLFANGTISTESIGISYIPTTSADQVANGELTFGGVDTSKTTSDVAYVPITSTSPASQYWGIDQSVTYGDNTQLLDTTSGIVDTGTTLLMLATSAFQQYQQATGATLDQETGLLTVTQDQYDSMQSLFFNIGGNSYELTKNAQIWPRSLNSTLGGQPDQIYLVLADLGSDIGQGLDFIDGYVFLQRFYSVYDTTNSQVGFATTTFTDAETN